MTSLTGEQLIHSLIFSEYHLDIWGARMKIMKQLSFYSHWERNFGTYFWVICLLWYFFRRNWSHFWFVFRLSETARKVQDFPYTIFLSKATSLFGWETPILPIKVTKRKCVARRSSLVFLFYINVLELKLTYASYLGDPGWAPWWRAGVPTANPARPPASSSSETAGSVPLCTGKVRYLQ